MPTENSQEICVAGSGAVTPFGWSVPALLAALEAGQPASTKAPAAQAPPPPWAKHARLRRTSPIAKYIVAAGLEALGHPDDAEAAAQSCPERLGIILCIQNGCVNFSKRFYNEVLETPGMASPILFPETVFNSPASHLAAILGRTTINYTLVGDAATFPQGMAVAAAWLAEGRVDGALVLAGEEQDELTEHAYQLFYPGSTVTAGAGAVYLKRRKDLAQPALLLSGVTDTYTFADRAGRRIAAGKVAEELRAHSAPGALLVDSREGGAPLLDADEIAAWADYTGPRHSPKAILGEGLCASGAWQVAVAVGQLQAAGGPDQALVSVVGPSEQAAGVILSRSDAFQP